MVAVANRCTSLGVSGETTLTGAGGVILSSLFIPADAKLVLDPIATPVYVSSAPRFGTGAKIALSSDYKRMTLGRIVLMTYSGSATFSQSLFDATSVAGSVALSEATAPDGTNKQLVLTVGDYEHKAKDITVAPMGDSLTQGVNDKARGDYPQYRTAVAARLAAAGYRPKFVALVNATAAKRSNAKIIGTTLPPVPNNQSATQKVLAFNNLLTKEYAKAGHGELPDNFYLLDFIALLQNLIQSGKVPRDLKGYCARDAHPNWKGHDLIARAFAAKINEVCPKRQK